MTTRPDTQPPAAARTLHWLALPILLLAGCVSVPPTTAVLAPEAPVAVAAPVPTAGEAAKAAAAAASAVAVAATSQADEQVAAPVPVDPLRPEVRLDLDDRAARVDLWERVRRGFAMPDLDNDLVRDRERWYATRPDYVARMTERGGRYLFYIVEELEKRGMPTELALLPFIESAYNPQAMSVARASGMWQFIPSTGRDFELKQNVFRDDRRDVLASTRAALDYLQKLHGMFGDWHLALAAYNWGEGSVQRAIAKNQRGGLGTDYVSLRMPVETQGYVPKLQAVKNIVMRPASFNLQLPELYNHPYFLSVPIEHDIDVVLAIRLAGVTSDEFQNLNPQMNRPVILAAGTPQILLPYDNANRFVRELPQHRGPLTSWTTWIAPKTMKSAEAAHLAGMSEDELREVNRIPARMVIKSGSTLLVPRRSAMIADVSSTVADNATMMLAPDAPPLRKIALRAGRHDSVESVARRYRVSTAQVAQWNDTGTGAQFAPGQTVIVYVANKTRQGPIGAPSTRTAGARPASRTRVAASGGAKAGKAARSATSHKHVVARN
ncbi:MAG TPA: transglycosylase SLT domain-containing protein [Caldimonas sp.]|jgi:membrane-bound lytic murein transglycosylase D|nr:transglycosylase SLT domain-containing protein [Caldimonas sp.]